MMSEPAPEPAVHGRISSRSSASVGGLRVEVLDLNVGADRIVAETTTDARGLYSTPYPREKLGDGQKTRADLQVTVVIGDRVVARSVVRYNASDDEQIDLTLPADAQLLSEYETVQEAIAAVYPGALSALQENDDRRDITYLANKTGWDARAVAMAATAEALATPTRVPTGGAVGRIVGRAVPSAIPAAFYYALLRAGVPADPASLHGLSPAKATQVWRDAVKTGVIAPSLADQIPRAEAAYVQLSATTALTRAAVPGSSNLSELLEVSLGDNAESKQVFATLAVQDSGPKFWSAVAEKLGKDTARRLRLDGKLGLLTLDNAAVIKKLHDAQHGNLSDPAQLARAGYHDDANWAPLLADVSVPDPVPGDTLDDKRRNYAAAAAAQLRQSYPTATLASMIEAGTAKLDATGDVRRKVVQFLDKHQGAFEIGAEPVARFIARNGLGGEVDEPTLTQVKRLQRIYQISPHDTAMRGLLAAGIGSAREIATMDRRTFLARYQEDLGGTQSAELVYAKATQVSAAVTNLALSYAVARSAPSLGQSAAIMNATPGGSQTPENSGVLAYPMLESLFGSLDYCGCDECRSFLSPAAYLVDLLLFLDVNVTGSANPQQTLLGKRPDLEHLPLTCENTNRPLPYIDIVNEVLEYFVVNNPRRQQPEVAPTLDGFTGHDTDDQVSAGELSAEPQFVDDAAYTALLGEAYPPPLPFHQPLEAMRRLLGGLATTLADVMQALRADDSIERGGGDTYAWRDILAERIALSRQQYRLLTDSTVTLAELYGYPTGTSDNDVIGELTSVKAFARRSQLGYDDVVELLRTRFVNPDAVLIPRLDRLGVDFAQIKSLKDGTISDTDFTKLLRPGLDPDDYGGDILAWLRDDDMYTRITKLVVIAVPVDGDACNVDTLELRYSLPDPAANGLAAVEFVKFARLVRLWRVLGWSIADVDRAITGLWPAVDWPIGSDGGALGRLDAGLLATLPRAGVVAHLMRRLGLRVDRDLGSLLALWAPIDTVLYADLFAGHGGQTDAAFADDGYGNVLGDATVKLVDHAATVRGAANLTGAEYDAITADLGYDGTTPLGIEQVSAVYRRGWLARRLRISVVELLALLKMTAIDPFAQPDPPTPGIVALLDLLEEFRAAGVKPSDALRLVWGRNVAGARSLDDATFAAFTKNLRTTLAAVDSDFAVVDDPQGDIARARMSLVYDADVVATFFGLLDGTTVFATHYVGPDDGLPAGVVTASDGRLGYDDLGRRLLHTGPLHQAERDAIQAVAGIAADLSAAVGQLFTDTAAAESALFAAHPELRQSYTDYLASTDPVPAKRAALLAAVLPELVDRRKRQQTVLAAAAAAAADVTYGEALLGDSAVLHASGDATRPALDDLTAVAEPGLTARFYFRATAAGTVDAGPSTAASIDYAAGTATTLPPAPGNAPISATWTGWLQAPQAGQFAFTITAEPGATVHLSLAGADVPLTGNAGVWRNDDPVVLAPDGLTAIVLTVENVTSTVSLRWNAVGIATQVIPGRYLYPGDRADAARAALERFLCASALATITKLTAAETAYLAKSGWLNAIPATGVPGPTLPQALLDPLREWCEFAVAKARFSPSDDRLLAVALDPALLLDDGSSALAALTGWDGTSTTALLAHLGLVQADVATPTKLRRIADAFDAVTAVGVDAATLVATITNDPSGDTARTLRAALRARTDTDTWLSVVKPINDTLRELQRDALVAFVLARLAEDDGTKHVDTVDKLFEYFLMDVQMQSCTQTSRIRHALSSVQLFVDRCLLNLEPGIQPSAIKASRWEWMKRYRVWEANRKVFLWPENWLEPELRDDASPIFTDVMGELLQGDITDDAAATALGSYLVRLEEIARLEPCGIFIEENSPGVQDDVVHVIGRTHGAHRKYFYRRRTAGSWLPWVRMKLDIEDDPVVPCVWQGRLFAFWIRLVQQSQQQSSIPGRGDNTNLTSLTRADVGGVVPKVTFQAVLCYSEYVNGTWQPAKTSDVAQPTNLITCTPAQFNRAAVRLNTTVSPDGGLDVRIVGDGFSSLFHLYTTHSAPVRAEDMPPSNQVVIMLPQPARDLSTDSADLVATYYPSFLFYGTGNTLTRDILTTPYGDRVVVPEQDLDNVWDAPFLYSDAHNCFYVTTTEQLVSILVFDGYGQVGSSMQGQAVPKIPPVLVDQSLIPDPLGPVETRSPYLVDPGATSRIVSEDAYIHVGIANSTTVSYGGRLIGPTGGLAAGAAREQ
jgi:hypothetical protein